MFKFHYFELVHQQKETQFLLGTISLEVKSGRCENRTILDLVNRQKSEILSIFTLICKTKCLILDNFYFAIDLC